MSWESMRSGIVVAAAALAASPSFAVIPAQARAAWASGTFVYADLCMAAESGAPMGRRIVLKRSPNGDALVYEAALRDPVPASALSVEEAGRAIAFTVETASGAVAFHGALDNEALTGVLDDASGSHPVRLPRVLRSHAREACRDAAR